MKPARASLVASLAVACSVGYEGEGPRAEARDYLDATAASLRAGEIERAEELLQRARSRFGGDEGVLLWSALLGQMRGRDREALRDFLALRRSAGLAGLAQADLHGRIGDLMFRDGRWAESIPYLLAAATGEQQELRKALATLAALLPYERHQPRALAAEMPLIGGRLPRLVCTIGGKQRPLVLDTGATYTTVTTTLATELGVQPILPAGRALDGTGQPFAIAVGKLAGVELAEVGLGDMPVLVVADDRLLLRDLSGGTELSAEGVVGQDVLLRFRVTFDPGRGSVLCELPRGLAESESVPCVRHEGRLLAPVRCEGQTLWLVIDTGASHSSLTEQGLAVLPGGARRVVESYAKLRGPGGTAVAVRAVTGLALVVGGMRFAAVDLPVLSRGPSGIFPVHGVLGADLLLRCRVTIDSQRLRLAAVGPGK